MAANSFFVLQNMALYN